MKDQLGVMQYQPLAVGRDNGVTALRHDTPISVSQAEDEVMVGFGSRRASRTDTVTQRRYSRENDSGALARVRERDGENDGEIDPIPEIFRRRTRARVDWITVTSLSARRLVARKGMIIGLNRGESSFHSAKINNPFLRPSLPTPAVVCRFDRACFTHRTIDASHPLERE